MSERDPLEWEEISCEHIVKDEWIDIRKSAFRFPDGSVFEPYYSYSRKDYSVIVAEDENGDYLCVRQYRQGIRKVTNEFPAGGIENGSGPEDALSAAKRELLEETGYESSDWRHLLTIASNATIADNHAYIYYARGCRKVRDQSLDETEFLKVTKHSADEIEQLIANGDFEQSMHVLAWLLSRRA
ncbi:MAG: NUDIX hydrolase [Lachnospiraceae bacterium]|nr:NUDIX hydrolase [Lachnospiraceae bacterium]